MPTTCRAALPLVVFLALAAASPARAGVVTVAFEGLRHEDAGIHLVDLEYVESGFRFAATHPEPGNPHRFGTLGTQHFGFNGSTALFNQISNGVVTLTRADGSPFDLLSVELTELPGGNGMGGAVNLGPFDVTFLGNVRGGGTVTQTFRVENFLTPTAFSFIGFTNLDSVTWAQGAGGPTSPTQQFDNVRLADAVAVPEPGGMIVVLWVAGIAAFLLGTGARVARS